jgi:hypothetical protein
MKTELNLSVKVAENEKYRYKIVMNSGFLCLHPPDSVLFIKHSNLLITFIPCLASDFVEIS